MNKIFESAMIALDAIWSAKLRSFMTVLGNIVAVTSIIAVVSLIQGLNASVKQAILNQAGADSFNIQQFPITRSDEEFDKVRGNPRITMADARAIRRYSELVTAVMADAAAGGRITYRDKSIDFTRIQGVTGDYLEARDWPVTTGRSFNPEDNDGASKVALLGQTTAFNLFGDADPLGQVIRIKKVPFTVIGLLSRKGQSSWGQDQDDLIMIPLSTAKKKVLGVSQANPRSVQAISIKVRAGEDMADAEQQIRGVLRQRHRLQPYQDDDFWLRNLSEVLQTQEESSKVMTYLLAAIASVSLLVGGIGIMNIMLVSVTERTREIGLRMAVGARGRDILLQFLVEAITLSLIGGIIGIVFGLGGSRAISYLAEWRTLVSMEAIVLAFGFAALIGIFFGFYPARKAARLDPIEALRYE